MELLALLAVFLLALSGHLVCKIFCANLISSEDRFYFAPAIGAGVCGIVAYLAVHLRHSGFITVFACACVIGALYWRASFKITGALKGEAWRLLRFTLITAICLYLMQIFLFRLYASAYPGPNGVWTLYNLTGVSPPDQMFAWHQAMFANFHLRYPQDAFYGDMDLYDRPHLGGYVTLFFFKLFHLPLRTKHYEYPAGALRFYQCLWWLLNDLYLFAVAPLFSRLFGRRAAVFAVASTALGGYFFICSSAVWMKFASAYPLLLAFYLFLLGRGPILQAGLCAVSYYIHGSVIPFLAGFGLLQIISVFYPIRGSFTPFRDLVRFALTGCVLVGAWFLIVHSVGSKQPLVYYYIYDAGLTEAQTRPVAEIVRNFYAAHSWNDLSLLPLRNWLRSLFPVASFDNPPEPIMAKPATGLSNLATAIFSAQKFCVGAVLGLITLPIVFAGFGKALLAKYSGRIVLCLYLIPTLFMLLLYRRPWALPLHIVYAYHTFALCLWVLFWKSARASWLTAALSAIAVEGAICVLFADLRILPAHRIQPFSLPVPDFLYLEGYVALIVVVLVLAHFELRRFPVMATEPLRNFSATTSFHEALVVGRKLGIAVLLSALVFGVYSLALRFAVY